MPLYGFDTSILIKMLIKRTHSKNLNFINLVQSLDKELALADGSEHSFYSQFNKIDQLNNVVLISAHSLAIACGAIKVMNDTSVEIKRMYVRPEFRNKGLASKVLAELEKWVKELGYKRCVLETGKRQVGATELYLKNGYKIIPNYGQYSGIENSVCFEKMLD